MQGANQGVEAVDGNLYDVPTQEGQDATSGDSHKEPQGKKTEVRIIFSIKHDCH